MAQRGVESTRAIQEVFETDFLKTAAKVYAAASTNMAINGFAHFIVSAATNNVFTLDHLIQMKLAFDKANVPEVGRIVIVDPVVEATLNKSITLGRDVTEFAANILSRGLASGQRFFTEWFGWVLITSNRLHVAAANDGTTNLASAVYNIFMSVLDDNTKPIMAAWRRAPKTEGERNKDFARDEYVTRCRYGFGVQRIDTLGCVATHPTNIV